MSYKIYLDCLFIGIDPPMSVVVVIVISIQAYQAIGTKKTWVGFTSLQAVLKPSLSRDGIVIEDTDVFCSGIQSEGKSGPDSIVNVADSGLGLQSDIAVNERVIPRVVVPKHDILGRDRLIFKSSVLLCEIVFPTEAA
jgi:hypothetical protein